MGKALVQQKFSAVLVLQNVLNSLAVLVNVVGEIHACTYVYFTLMFSLRVGNLKRSMASTATSLCSSPLLR